MTDIKLLPLPEPTDRLERFEQRRMRKYARANVAHHCAAKDAEIARLQEEIDNRWAQGVHTCHENCQRVACVQRREIEALRAMLGECYVLSGADTDGDPPERHFRDAVRAVGDLRRDYDEALAEPDYKARVERLTEALDIIARVGKASRKQTNRSRWIVTRAISALNGDDDWQALPKPKGFHNALLYPTTNKRDK